MLQQKNRIAEKLCSSRHMIHARDFSCGGNRREVNVAILGL